MSKKKKIIFGIIVIILILLLAVTFIVIKTNKKEIKNTCIVQFETLGGSKIEAQVIEKGIKVIKPENPVKLGFSFIEWQLNGRTFDFETSITENIIIIAKWEVNKDISICKVSFDSDGGAEVTSIEVAQGTSITAPIAPNKEGFTFKGWFQGDEKFDFSNPISEDIILKAKWKEGETKITDKTVDISEGVVTTFSDEIKENTSYGDIDDMVLEYSGKWFLEGYSDVYITIKKQEYANSTCMEIVGTNIDSATGDIYVQFKNNSVFGFGFTIDYENFKDDLLKNGISLKGNQIIFKKNNKTFTFVRNRGSKDKYDYFGSIYEAAEGMWYLYNNPDTVINIEIHRNSYSGVQYDVNCDTYAITTSYGGEIAYISGEYCNATDNSLFNKYGITVSGDVLTYNYGGKLKTFYKTKKVIPVEKVTLMPDNVVMYVGDTKELIPTINPSNAYYKDFYWSCTNNDIINFNYGKITAINVGKAIMSYKVTALDKEYIGYCNIEVLPYSVDGISLNKKSISLYKGETENLTVKITPDNATNKKVYWNSSNTSVAIVDTKGKVTANGVGNAIITAKSEDGGYTVSCNVVVSNPKLKVDGNIGISTIITNEGVSSGIKVTANPSGGTGNYTSYNIKLYYNGNLIGESSNSTLFVNQSDNGTYSATITVIDSNGETVTVKKTITKS